MVVVSVVLSIRFNSGLRSPKRWTGVSEANLLHLVPHMFEKVYFFDVEKLLIHWSRLKPLLIFGWVQSTHCSSYLHYLLLLVEHSGTIPEIP